MSATYHVGKHKTKPLKWVKTNQICFDSTNPFSVNWLYFVAVSKILFKFFTEANDEIFYTYLDNINGPYWRNWRIWIQTSDSEPQWEFCRSTHWGIHPHLKVCAIKLRKEIVANGVGTHRQMVDGYLCEFMWRQRYMNKDLLSVLLNCIANYDSNNENIVP